MHDEVSILLIIIFILGCVIIYLWQHRKTEEYEPFNIDDTIEKISKTLEKSRKEYEKEFYNSYIKTLIEINSSDYMKANEAWLRVVDIIDDNLPFFKTAYVSTLIFEDSRYTNIAKDVSEDISEIFKELETFIDKDDLDMELLADRTLLVLKWFYKYKFKDPTK